MPAGAYISVQGVAWDSIAFRLQGEERHFMALVKANLEQMDMVIFTAVAALALLKKYVARHGRRYLHFYIPTGWLAHTHGIISSTLLRDSAFVYDAMRKARAEKRFEQFLQGKSIALVGNGPQELGLGKGREIDAHDVVIRLNNAVVNQECSKDYGLKTDVYCRNSMQPHQYDAFPAARFLLLPKNCERHQSSKEQVLKLASTIRQHNRILIAPSRQEMQKLLQPLAIASCSLGFLTAILIRSLAPQFSADDIYGMSFTQDQGKNYLDTKKAYYFPAAIPADAYEAHSLEQERAAFKAVFAVP